MHRLMIGVVHFCIASPLLGLSVTKVGVGRLAPQVCVSHHR